MHSGAEDPDSLHSAHHDFSMLPTKPTVTHTTPKKEILCYFLCDKTNIKKGQKKNRRHTTGFVQKPNYLTLLTLIFSRTFFLNSSSLSTDRKQTVYNRSNPYSTKHSQGKNEQFEVFHQRFFLFFFKSPFLPLPPPLPPPPPPLPHGSGPLRSKCSQPAAGSCRRRTCA